MKFYITIHEPNEPIRDSGEGPFDSYEEAATFGETEVGLPYTIDAQLWQGGTQ